MKAGTNITVHAHSVVEFVGLYVTLSPRQNNQTVASYSYMAVMPVIIHPNSSNWTRMQNP
jgi:Na+-transporting methylmalonyl-CoA/oxaloacetate decarboxylase beta subunit